MDYQKRGEEELDLAKDDALRVFKRYNHWSYVCCIFVSFVDPANCRATQAVKEDGGDRGWVPVRSVGITRSHNHSCLSQSWFIGKVATPTNASTNTPQTPAISVQQTQVTSDDTVGHSQVSPMSSAFPTVQTRA